MKTVRCYICYEKKSCYHAVEVVVGEMAELRNHTDVSSKLGSFSYVCPSCARASLKKGILIISTQMEGTKVSCVSQ